MIATNRKSLYTLLALVGALGLVMSTGCSKDEKKDKKTPVAKGKAPMKKDMGKMNHDMGKMKAGDKGKAPMKHDMAKMMANARKVDVKVNADGYAPSVIPAKAGEHLKLMFTLTTDKSCGNELVIGSTGKKYTLPLNKAVEVPVMVGQSGEVTFACGMNMLKGKIVVQ